MTTALEKAGKAGIYYLHSGYTYTTADASHYTTIFVAKPVVIVKIIMTDYIVLRCLCAYFAWGAEFVNNNRD